MKPATSSLPRATSDAMTGDASRSVRAWILTFSRIAATGSPFAARTAGRMCWKSAEIWPGTGSALAAAATAPQDVCPST